MTSKEVEKKYKKAKSGDLVLSLESNGFIRYFTKESSIKVLDDALVDMRWGRSKLCDLSQVVAILPKGTTIDTGMTLGSDPELFLMEGDEVVPSSVIIGKDRLEDVVPDGFQVELNPQPNSCRESAGYYIARALEELEDYALGKNLALSFKLAHRISDSVWKQTPSEVKRFGCSPTETAYRGKSKRVSGIRERLRAGGGHVHIGYKNAVNNIKDFVKLLDIVVGNTLVLIDRDPANKERRKHYGRAGEYRPKTYGLEYRVPSNFWLRGYVTWSMVGALIRNAATLRENNLESKLLSLFDLKDIREAINNNDYELAMKNFLIYKKFLEDNDIFFKVGISKHNVEQFVLWAEMEDPLSLINDGTTDAIISDWHSRRESYRSGFEYFLSNIS